MARLGKTRVFMVHDVPTELLIRTFADRFSEGELIAWSVMFRAERNCGPLTLWATIVDEVTRPFVQQGISTLTDLTTAAVRHGLRRIEHDRDAVLLRQPTPDEIRRSADEREKSARMMKEFQAGQLGQTTVKAKKVKPVKAD